MNLLIWLIVGGLIGWLASILMKTNDQQVQQRRASAASERPGFAMANGLAGHAIRVLAAQGGTVT